MAGDEYLRYAEQCIALAAKSSNPGDKARLLQMAQAWRDLSGQRDHEPKRPHDFKPASKRK
ncbi:hypothetical protein [Bradyrhizobium sp.]|uniref:hypothetical protein n=1 Tax=Bradyrhizobium sp. TaxID=376 RepID=UPI002E1803DE